MRYYLLLHVVVFLWAATSILGKLISLSPMDLVIWRTGISAVGFIVIALMRGESLLMRWARAWPLVLVGAIMGWHWVLFFLSARLSTASVCLATLPTMMIFGSLMEPVFNGTRRWSKLELSSGLVIVLGLWIIYRAELQHLAGLLVGLASAVLASVFSVANKRFTQRHPWSVLCAYQMVGACVGTLVLLPFITGHGLPALPAASDLTPLLTLALLCTVVTYGAFMVVLRHLEVFSVNVLFNLEPVYGMILATFFLGRAEQMSTAFYGGAVLIMSAVIVIPILQRQAKR
jgi:drug/metabolite transporter (DMT)-like permease